MWSTRRSDVASAEVPCPRRCCAETLRAFKTGCGITQPTAVVQEGCSARVAEAEERLGGIASACNVMRESLEYVRVRIGTSYVGESLEKIDKALSSSSTIISSPNHKGANSHPA